MPGKTDAILLRRYFRKPLWLEFWGNGWFGLPAWRDRVTGVLGALVFVPEQAGKFRLGPKKVLGEGHASVSQAPGLLSIPRVSNSFAPRKHAPSEAGLSATVLSGGKEALQKTPGDWRRQVTL